MPQTFKRANVRSHLQIMQTMLCTNRPFAQLLPGLETGHLVTVGQSPAHELHSEQSETETRKTAFCSSKTLKSCAGDWPTVTVCPVSNPGYNCANGLLHLLLKHTVWFDFFFFEFPVLFHNSLLNELFYLFALLLSADWWTMLTTVWKRFSVRRPSSRTRTCPACSWYGHGAVLRLPYIEESQLLVFPRSLRKQIFVWWSLVPLHSSQREVTTW